MLQRPSFPSDPFQSTSQFQHFNAHHFHTIGALPKAEDFDGRAFAFQLDEYAGSLLVDVETWSTISKEVGPDLMVAPVSDQFVFMSVVPDGDDLEGLKQVAARDCAHAARCISPHIYRFRGGMWVIAD